VNKLANLVVMLKHKSALVWKVSKNVLVSDVSVWESDPSQRVSVGLSGQNTRPLLKNSGRSRFQSCLGLKTRSLGPMPQHLVYISLIYIYVAFFYF